MSDSSEAKIANWMERETLAEYLVPLCVRYDVKWRGHGIIYVDHEQYNVATAQMILADLSSCLGVSKKLVRSRLMELGWLNDARSALPVRDATARVIDKLEFLVEEESEWDLPGMDNGNYQD